MFRPVLSTCTISATWISSDRTIKDTSDSPASDEMSRVVALYA